VRFLLCFATLLLLLVFASSAWAQDLGPERPNAQGQAPSSVQATDAFPTDGSWSNWLIQDGANHLDPTNWFEEKPILNADGITTDHLTLVTSMGGDVVVRAITVNAAGVPSEPSVKYKTVQSIPGTPNLVSDTAQASGMGEVV